MRIRDWSSDVCSSDLIAAVDRASTAIIGYDVVYRSEVTSDNILKVIRDAVTKRWQPMAFTVPFHYPPEGGLPSGVIPEAYGAAIGRAASRERVCEYV